MDGLQAVCTQIGLVGACYARLERSARRPDRINQHAHCYRIGHKEAQPCAKEVVIKSVAYHLGMVPSAVQSLTHGSRLGRSTVADCAFNQLRHRAIAFHSVLSSKTAKPISLQPHLQRLLNRSCDAFDKVALQKYKDNHDRRDRYHRRSAGHHPIAAILEHKSIHSNR